jgi:hypothetical protein
MSRQEVVDKALDLIAPILGRERGQKLIDAVVGIDRIETVLAIRPLLQSPA